MLTICDVCGVGDMIFGDSATFYCSNCGVQATNYIEEEFEAEDVNLYNAAFIRERGVSRTEVKTTTAFPQGTLGGPGSEDPLGAWTVGANGQPQYGHGHSTVSQHDSQLGQGSGEVQILTKQQSADAIRRSYVAGLQNILQMQCERLVMDFGVTPLICGIVGPIWLRYLAQTRVFADVWVDAALEVAEHRERERKGNSRRIYKETRSDEGEGGLIMQLRQVSAEAGVLSGGMTLKKRKRLKVKKPRKRRGEESLRTSYGRKSCFVWLDALKERLPLTITLALSYLACYIAREPVLPTDISKWASEGKLPYLNAFVEISKQAPHHIPSTVGRKPLFSMDPRLMFQPQTIVGARTVERQAGFIAERIGIQLPPVNFHAISSRFLIEMGLPTQQLAPFAYRLYEWYTPSGLWLSTREGALPTSVYSMAMLVIIFKVLYKLDGRSPQQREEKHTQEVEERSPTSTDNGNGDVPHTYLKMVTRAMRKADAEVGEVKQPRTNLESKGKEMAVCGLSASQGKILPKTVCKIPAKRRRPSVSDANEMVQGNANDLRDVQWLLEKLNSVKQKNAIDYDKELSSYVKYCQDVVFAGCDLDSGFEYTCNQFWGFYEKEMAKASKLVVSTTERHDLPGGSFGTVRGNIDNSAEVQRGTFARKSSHESETLSLATRAGLSNVQSVGVDLGTKSALLRQVTVVKGMDKKEDNMPSDALGCIQASAVGTKVRELRDSSSLVDDMKNAGFSCLPPFAGCLDKDEYLRYSFYNSEEDMIPVHEDYFNILQACSRLVNVHERALHRCVQIIEKGLVEMETNIEKVLLEWNGDTLEPGHAVKRKEPYRNRDKIAEVEAGKIAIERVQHLLNSDYL